VGVTDGDALFPRQMIRAAFTAGLQHSQMERSEGLFADFTAHNAPIIEEVKKVPCFNLATLMRDNDRVDLIHCDIQGQKPTRSRASLH
jgi:hypothetical protein